MGACLSSGGGKPILTVTDGGEEEYKNRFEEDRVLGEGEFGVVKLVRDKKKNSEEDRWTECSLRDCVPSSICYCQVGCIGERMLCLICGRGLLKKK